MGNHGHDCLAFGNALVCSGVYFAQDLRLVPDCIDSSAVRTGSSLLEVVKQYDMGVRNVLGDCIRGENHALMPSRSNISLTQWQQFHRYIW